MTDLFFGIMVGIFIMAGVTVGIPSSMLENMDKFCTSGVEKYHINLLFTNKVTCKNGLVVEVNE